MVSKQRKIKAVIFDLDGTLLNVYDRYYASYVKALESLGIHKKPKKDDLIQMRREGMSGFEIVRHLAPGVDGKTSLKVDSLRKKIVNDGELLFMDYPFPEVKGFLAGLKASNVILVILTLRPQQNVEQQLEKLSLLRYFDKVVTKQNANSPLEAKYEGLKEILEQFRLASQNTVIVDDTEHGIRAGHKIGAITVGVLSGLSGKAMLEKEKPDIILENVTELRLDKSKGLIL